MKKKETTNNNNLLARIPKKEIAPLDEVGDLSSSFITPIGISYSIQNFENVEDGHFTYENDELERVDLGDEIDCIAIDYKYSINVRDYSGKESIERLDFIDLPYFSGKNGEAVKELCEKYSIPTNPKSWKNQNYEKTRENTILFGFTILFYLPKQGEFFQIFFKKALAPAGEKIIKLFQTNPLVRLKTNLNTFKSGNTNYSVIVKSLDNGEFGYGLPAEELEDALKKF
jgi:hypothetical protein